MRKFLLFLHSPFLASWQPIRCPIILLRVFLRTLDLTEHASPNTLQTLIHHNSQWGHVIVLHAAYKDPRLRPYVPAHNLMELTKRVRQFLVSVAHPSSALADDIRILDYATDASGLRKDIAAMSRRGSRGGSRGGSGGAAAGSSFGSTGSDMGSHIMRA